MYIIIPIAIGIGGLCYVLVKYLLWKEAVRMKGPGEPLPPLTFLPSPTNERAKTMYKVIDTYGTLIKRYASIEGVDPHLIAAMISQESGGDPYARAKTSSAKGLMQLIDSTAAAMAVPASMIFDPEQNIKGGTRYMGDQVREFGDANTALSAYYAGPGCIKGLTTRCPPPSAIQEHVTKVTNYYNDYPKVQEGRNIWTGVAHQVGEVIPIRIVQAIPIKEVRCISY